MCNCPNCGAALKMPSGQFFIATKFGFVHNFRTGNCAPDIRSAEGFSSWAAADACASHLAKRGVFKYWSIITAGCTNQCPSIDNSSEL